MRVTVNRGAAIVAGAAALLAVPSPASAHEKWFVDDADRYPTDWAFLLRNRSSPGSCSRSSS